MAGRRRERSFDAGYFVGLVFAVLLLAGILLFLILLYIREPEDFDDDDIIKALKNLTSGGLVVNVTIPPINVTIPPLNLSALIMPVCLLYQYDVAYACGERGFTDQFGDFVEGTYSGTFLVENPNTFNITYDAFITAVIPMLAVDNPFVNLTLGSKETHPTFTCFDPDLFLMLSSSGGEKRDVDQDTSPQYNANKNDATTRTSRQKRYEAQINEYGHSPEVVEKGHHMQQISSLKRQIDKRSGIFTRQDANFYAGVFSVASSSRLSAWIIQTVVDGVSDAPDIETIPATETCILFSNAVGG